MLDVPVGSGAAATLMFAPPAGEPPPRIADVTTVDTATGARRLHQRIGASLALHTVPRPGRLRVGAGCVEGTL